MFADSKLQGITGDSKKAFEFVVGALLTFSHHVTVKAASLVSVLSQWRMR
jgi:hypothetical protein